MFSINRQMEVGTNIYGARGREFVGAGPLQGVLSCKNCVPRTALPIQLL